VRHTELNVRFKVGVIVRVDLRSQSLEAFLINQGMKNGPRSDCDVSVAPLSPLFSRQTREDTPSDPAINDTSLCVGRQLSHFVQDRNRLLKLGLGESDLSHKAVQMANQRNHDLAETGIRGPLHDSGDRTRDLFLAVDDLFILPNAYRR
jgi:hypothetical protein